MRENMRRSYGQVLEMIREADDLSISEILEKSEDKWSRRTLQRILSSLLMEGVIRRKGEKKGIRYFATTPQVDEELLSSSESIFNLSLSLSAQKVQSYVTAPLNTRKPIWYNRSFLGEYIPNATFYLSQEERKKLWQLGKQRDGKNPPGTFIRKFFERFLVDFSWNSSRLEGNTYSLLETHLLLINGIEPKGKALFETTMIWNHKKALEFLVDSADSVKMSSVSVKILHSLLSEGLLRDPMACGQIRKRPVGIVKSVFYPLEVPQVIEECFEEIVAKALLIEDPFEQSFFVMVHLPYLQPFEDVNKRTSRIAANIPLIKNNLSPLSFVDVPDDLYVQAVLGVYELNRIELLKEMFLWAYARSALRYSAIRHTVGTPDLFRMRHQEAIRKVVREVVVQKMDKQKTIPFIHEWADEHLQKTDRARFIEFVETELMALHIGNSQIYDASPDQFLEWHPIWASN